MPLLRRECHRPAPLHWRRASRGGLGPRSLSEGAFTLIELMTVMGIIVILVSLGVSAIQGTKQRAAIARAKSELSLLAQALEDYKRHYGDYPQTGAAGQANAVVTAAVGATQAEALLFNALTGVYGPTNFTTRLNGPTLVDVSKFSLEQALTPATFAIPTGVPPAKPLVANCFIDPWGNRYIYFYKRATPVNAVAAGAAPAFSGAALVSPWQAPGYVLYSAGPDGQQTAPNANTGLYTGTTQTTGTNADNIYADKLP